MKNESQEKAELRRYLDDLYTREEARKLFDSLQNGEYRQSPDDSMPMSDGEVQTPNESLQMLGEMTREVWEESSALPATSQLGKERYRQEARQLITRIEHRKRTWLRRSIAVAASIAAIFLIAFGSVYYLRHVHPREVSYVQVSTGFKETKNIVLPDGTQLTLNSCSQIRYPDRFTGETRLVELTGEGFFHVKPDASKPFIVNTSRFDVRVLGTQFDVKSYPQDEVVSVSVESGQVQVDIPDAMMRLGRQEEVFINTVSGEYGKRKEEKDVAVWRKGGLRFRNTSIRDVAKELERMYNCTITFDTGQSFDNRISGDHDNVSLESVLNSLEYTSGVKYKKDGRNIRLYK